MGDYSIKQEHNEHLFAIREVIRELWATKGDQQSM